MSIQIDRFAAKNIKNSQQAVFEEKGWVGIKDRENWKCVGLVNVFKDYKKNTDLANRIIEIIEDEINGAENQH